MWTRKNMGQHLRMLADYREDVESHIRQGGGLEFERLEGSGSGSGSEIDLVLSESGRIYFFDWIRCWVVDNISDSSNHYRIEGNVPYGIVFNSVIENETFADLLVHDVCSESLVAHKVNAPGNLHFGYEGWFITLLTND